MTKISIAIYFVDKIDKKKQIVKLSELYSDFDSFEISFFKWDINEESDNN